MGRPKENHHDPEVEIISRSENEVFQPLNEMGQRAKGGGREADKRVAYKDYFKT